MGTDQSYVKKIQYIFHIIMADVNYRGVGNAEICM